MNRSVCCLGLLVAALASWPCISRADTIYVDTSGIDGIPALTDDEKASLKVLLLADMQANFNVAIGSGKITVTSDPTKKDGAARRVSVKNDVGSSVKADGSTGYRYGEWFRGGTDVNVHIKNLTERHGDDYKSGGKWDLEKLRKSLGRTAAHEVAHSYSVGHNKDVYHKKMTNGLLVTSQERANTEWTFYDNFTKKTLLNNLGKPPCRTEDDYDSEYISPRLYDDIVSPNDPDESGNFDSVLTIGGALASKFDLGWYGVDSDNGADGSSLFDFIFKTSLTGIEGEDAPMLTFFPDAHGTVQFLLQGVAGDIYAGQWFPMSGAAVEASNPILRPDGQTVYQFLNVGWDIDGIPGADVLISLNAANVYPYPGGGYNGWVILPEPGTISLLLAGGLALLGRRRRRA